MPAAAPPGSPLVRWFGDVGSGDVQEVGGKTASLGEMARALVPKGVRIPNGFATPTDAFRLFLQAPLPRKLPELWADLDAHEALLDRVAATATVVAGLKALFRGAPPEDQLEMYHRTALARALLLGTPLPPEVAVALESGYATLEEEYGENVDVAVRSSSVREDSEMASFAGQYESYLNIQGAEAVKTAWKMCAASAFTERAVSYQLSKGLDPLDSPLAVIVMKMVRSDLATSGVLFTLDPDSGNRNVVHLTSSYGLGELVVQGSVSPDTYLLWKEGLRRGLPAVVHRTLGAKDQKLVYSMQGGTATESVDVQAAWRREWSLSEEEAVELARMGMAIEEHYGRPMDIEWAKDGVTEKLFIVQARPETVHGPNGDMPVMVTYRMDPALAARLEAEGKVLLTGHAVGTRIASGRVRLYEDYEEVILKKRALRNRLKAGEPLDRIPPEERVFDPGDVLVTELTTPDWEPMMKDASLIITEKGGRTSHAAIVAREFGIPAIVGCHDATRVLQPLQKVTGSCAQGDVAQVFEGIHPFQVEKVAPGELPPIETLMKLNVGFPDRALQDALLPCDGVGLARLEFILTAQVGIHPLALLYFDELQEFARTGALASILEPYRDRLEREGPEEIRSLVGAVERRTPAHTDRRRFFVDQLRDGVALICAAFHPRPVLVRLSDLKSNEYRDLLGGKIFEPEEENPMIAWRGASRYTHPRFLPAFQMECEALRQVRRDLGLDNLQIMVPFCRTPQEGKEVVRLLAEEALGPQGPGPHGDDGVPLFLMVEIPSNVLEGEAFIRDMALAGASIGSNDLVQTVYAVSRDDLEDYAYPVDARSPGVQTMIRSAIDIFTGAGVEMGICGQAPSDFPEEIPPFLVECGITSISVTPDTFYRARAAVAKAEVAKAGLAKTGGAKAGVAKDGVAMAERRE
ncbi:MAG: phosphoenolpyruvate synthase [Gemmatimonadota bacterium]